MINLDAEYKDCAQAETLLNRYVELEPMRKAFYSFDFSTLEGVASFIGLLLLADESIIKQAYAEVWPGSLGSTFNVDRARLELRGYFLDMLDAGLFVSPEEEGLAAEEASSEIAAEEQELEEPAGDEEPVENTEGEVEDNGE